jgi:hypothetical protein
MKTKLFILSITGCIILGLSLPTEAFAHPPYWAPAHGYRAHTRQIYYPDYNCYYDIQRGSYVYFDNGNWRVSVNLPAFINRNAFMRSRRVELEVNNFTPERYNREHMVRYNSYRPEWGYDRRNSDYYRRDRDYYDRDEHNHWNHRERGRERHERDDD